MGLVQKIVEHLAAIDDGEVRIAEFHVACILPRVQKGSHDDRFNVTSAAMPFPQRVQASDATSRGDPLDVRDVPNDFKHWTPVTAAAASARTDPTRSVTSHPIECARSHRTSRFRRTSISLWTTLSRRST